MSGIRRDHLLHLSNHQFRPFIILCFTRASHHEQVHDQTIHRRCYRGGLPCPRRVSSLPTRHGGTRSPLREIVTESFRAGGIHRDQPEMISMGRSSVAKAADDRVPDPPRPLPRAHLRTCSHSQAHEDDVNMPRMQRSTLLRLLVAFATLACVAWAQFDHEGVVSINSKKEFATTVKGDKPTFVKFYAPWCGHWCVQEKQTWTKRREDRRGVEARSQKD